MSVFYLSSRGNIRNFANICEAADRLKLVKIWLNMTMKLRTA